MVKWLNGVKINLSPQYGAMVKLKSWNGAENTHKFT